jgi:rhodanese-related sulfurtransferase
MKSLTTCVALLAISLSGSLALAQQPPAAAPKAPNFKAHVLTNSELDTLVEKPEKLLFIDLRRPDEVSTIGGFPIYLSVQIDDLEKNLSWIPKDRTIVTVSNHAGRAGKAADLLASKGFKVAGAVGTQTYEQAGGKAVVHIAVPPPRTAPTPAAAK